MVENLIGIYFSSEIDINIDMKFDQALNHELFWNTWRYELLYHPQYLPVSVNGVFLFFLSILLSEICLNIHILPFIRPSYSLKFHAQIAENGDSGSLDFKIFRGSSPGPPPPLHVHQTRTFGARCPVFSRNPRARKKNTLI